MKHQQNPLVWKYAVHSFQTGRSSWHSECYLITQEIGPGVFLAWKRTTENWACGQHWVITVEQIAETRDEWIFYDVATDAIEHLNANLESMKR